MYKKTQILLACVVILLMPAAVLAKGHRTVRHSVVANKNITKKEMKAVNVNTANAEALRNIKGIGIKKAKEIVKYREKNGNFKSVDDLKQVKGISQKLLDRIKDNLSLG